MKLILTCLFVFALVILLNGHQFRCDYKYSRQAQGWLKLHRIPANWREARLRCHLEGTNLASPLTNELKLAMVSEIQQAALECGVFTGISSFFSRGDFHSVEGIQLSKIPHTWVKGEPDNYNDNESCLLMSDNGELADVSCAETFPYLCYRKADRVFVNNICGTLDNEYRFDSRTGSCYKFHKVPRTWSRAYMACAAEGGHLAIINSDTEATVLRELFAMNPASSMIGSFWKDVAFVGFHDWGEHGEFLTIEGKTLKDAGYAKFSGGEPNNATTGEFCGAIYRSALFDDLWCENPYAFICEKKPDSLVCDD
ncbi:macrophage mannose receptor 1 [Bicyclus anynana]|uniref:Macrophage mannose receptor 1 n=1 Tax=Bicyclus anynana TaxID=110368 RepID=A0A6J1NW08_BICAN|nr:macrophage mannose receptor 1 [Bicyclus anynana]